MVQATTEGLAGTGTQATPLVPDLFRIARRLRRAGGPQGVDVAALLMLHRLASDGPKRPSDLAAEMGLDLSTVSRHVKTLDDGGLVTREADPADRRSFRLSVTLEGVRITQAGLMRRERTVDEVLGHWDRDDAATLRRLLGRLADDLDNLGEEAP